MLLVVAAWVVARLKAVACQVEPVQYKVLCWSVKVVLLAARPTPLLLSATLPPNVAGTVAARKLPEAGLVTDAVVGAVKSMVTLKAAEAAETLPAASVAVAVIVRTPVDKALAVME